MARPTAALSFSDECGNFRGNVDVFLGRIWSVHSGACGRGGVIHSAVVAGVWQRLVLACWVCFILCCEASVQGCYNFFWLMCLGNLVLRTLTQNND